MGEGLSFIRALTWIHLKLCVMGERLVYINGNAITSFLSI